jgi:hypothetical protein
MEWLRLKWYQYELWTGLYMLDKWEKTLFSTCDARQGGGERRVLWMCRCRGCRCVSPRVAAACCR